jgi:transcriptional regulator with XRE-family HTH domain
MREVRERRRWSQQDLAEKLASFGWAIDRTILAKMEAGQRGVSLDDAVAISAALGPALVTMLTPLISTGDEVVHLAPDVEVTPTQARHWMSGRGPLWVEDRRTYYADAPDEQLLQMGETSLAVMLGLLQQIIDAVIDDDRDTAAELIEDLNRQLARSRRVRDDRQRTERKRATVRDARKGR